MVGSKEYGNTADGIELLRIKIGNMGYSKMTSSERVLHLMDGMKYNLKQLRG